MTSEQEIEILKGQVAQLFSMVISSREAEIPVGACGPNFKREVLSSENPETESVNSTAFGCTCNGMVITIKLGKVFFKGVSITVTGFSSTVTVSATTYGYITIDLVNGAASWATAASNPGDGDDDTEIWRIFVATVSSGEITELLECQHGDIHTMGNA